MTYNPVSNESTVTITNFWNRMWSDAGTTATGYTTITVSATDSGENVSKSYSGDRYYGNMGYNISYPLTSDNVFKVKHSNTAGTKSVTISGSTSIKFYYNGENWTSGSGSKTITAGTYSG